MASARGMRNIRMHWQEEHKQETSSKAGDSHAGELRAAGCMRIAECGTISGLS
jgi:hypothetical protein